MKYLKKFENSALKYGEPEVIKGNQRIFTEVEIIDFNILYLNKKDDRYK